MPRRSNPTAGQSGKILSPRSSVWQFMELNRETRRARCRFCEKILAYTGGTTNLRYHLTAAHAMQEFEVIGPSAKVFKPGKTAHIVSSNSTPTKTPPRRKKAKVKTDADDEAVSTITTAPSMLTNSPSVPTEVPTIPAALNQTLSPRSQATSLSPSLSGFHARCAMPKGWNEDRSSAIHEKLLQMIVQSLQPIGFIESDGFQGYMKFLEPSYKLPDKQYLQNTLHTMYASGKIKLQEILAREASHFSIVYDLWKGSDQEAYTTITIHYLTSQWERKSWVLSTERIAHLRASGNEISSCIRQLMLQYQLPSQGLIATVNRQGMLKSQVERVGSTLSCESMSCAAEKLEMCVQTAFAIPEVKAVIEAAGRLSTYLLCDEEAGRTFQEVKDSDNALPQVELMQDRKSSWVATCEMLLKLLALKELIDRMADLDIKGTDIYLNEEKWDLLEKLVNSLQILKAALTVMSKKRTGSVSCLLPVVHSILQHCEDANHPPNSAMEKFLKTIGKETRDKWDLTAILPSSVPMLAALLDPRFKKLKFIAEEDKGDVFDALKGVLGSAAKVVDQAENNIVASSQDLSPFLCLFGGGDEYSQERQDADTEIASYVDFPALRHDNCPLDWWRVNQGRFPELAKLARQFLGVPAIAQQISDLIVNTSQVDMKRALLEAESAGPLIFMNHNWALNQQ